MVLLPEDGDGLCGRLETVAEGGAEVEGVAAPEPLGEGHWGQRASQKEL